MNQNLRRIARLERERNSKQPPTSPSKILDDLVVEQLGLPADTWATFRVQGFGVLVDACGDDQFERMREAVDRAHERGIELEADPEFVAVVRELCDEIKNNPDQHALAHRLARK